MKSKRNWIFKRFYRVKKKFKIHPFIYAPKGAYFSGCTHIKEENCGIKQAIEQGKIDCGRYERFCKIYEELKEKDKYKY